MSDRCGATLRLAAVDWGKEEVKSTWGNLVEVWDPNVSDNGDGTLSVFEEEVGNMMEVAEALQEAGIPFVLTHGAHYTFDAGEYAYDGGDADGFTYVEMLANETEQPVVPVYDEGVIPTRLMERACEHLAMRRRAVAAMATRNKIVGGVGARLRRAEKVLEHYRALLSSECPSYVPERADAPAQRAVLCDLVHDLLHLSHGLFGGDDEDAVDVVDDAVTAFRTVLERDRKAEKSGVDEEFGS